jgi:hypothetical protein
MSLLTASWLPPLFFSWSFVGFGEVVFVCVFLVWLFGLWVWKSGAGAALLLLLSFPIHLSDSLTWVPLQLVLSQSFPFTFLIPRLGYLCNWFCPRAFHSPF